MPPFRSVERTVRQPAFSRDAAVLLRLGSSQVEGVAQVVGGRDLFLGPAQLRRALVSVLGEPALAAQVAAFVIRLFEMRRVLSSEGASFTFHSVREAIEKNLADPVPLHERKILTDKLVTIGDAPALGILRQLKAEELVQKTGLELIELDIICDIRPVFDESGETIEGAIPLSVLRLLAIDAEGHARASEFRITEDQLAVLAAKAARTKSKLTSIKALIKASSVAMPQTAMTAGGGDE